MKDSTCPSNTDSGDRPIKIGISACLLGCPVRFDGGHKLDLFLKDTLGSFVDYVPVCPEAELGLGVPREPLRLEGSPGAPRLVTVRTKKEYTAPMTAWARGRAAALEREDLCGYIFKSRSPSCGMERVKVYQDGGGMSKSGAGLFVRIVMEHFPLLPVEEEGRLHDPELRENFIERIFVMRRWRDMLSRSKSRGGLVDFHTRHKLLLLSHSTAHYREMGRCVAAGMPPSSASGACAPYERLLMEALRLKATVKKHTNVLQHMMGYFKKQLTPDEKQEMLEVIGLYYREYVPLIVPLTLMKHYVRKYNQEYLVRQHYLDPHPAELKLRNHA